AQDGHRFLAETREQLHHMWTRQQRMPDVRHTLVIQRPARLLGIHRETDLPEFWVTHDCSPLLICPTVTLTGAQTASAALLFVRPVQRVVGRHSAFRSESPEKC